MNIKHFQLTLILLFISCSKGGPNPGSENEPSQWIKTFGGTKNDVANAVIATTDGGFAVLGYTQSNDGDLLEKSDESFDVWFLRFDAEGNMLWNKTYGAEGNDRGFSLLENQQGGYTLLGFKQSPVTGVPSSNPSRNIWLASVDSSGELLWEKTFGFSGIDYGTRLLQTQDGGYLLTGVLDVTASGGLGNRLAQRHAGGDYWLIKVDATGNIQWRNYYGGGFTDTPYDVTPTPDGGYIIIGSSDSNDTDISNNRGSYDFWVIKINNQGALVWERNYGGQQIDEAHAIMPDNQGNFIVVGDTRSSNHNVSSNSGGADLWVIKISAEGDLIQETTFGGTSFDVGRSLTRMQNNDWLISGSSRSADGDVKANKGQNDAWLLRLNPSGNSIQWEQSFGGSNIDFAYDAVQLQNKAIIMVGETSSNDGDLKENKGFSDLLIIKTNAQ